MYDVPDLKLVVEGCSLSATCTRLEHLHQVLKDNPMQRKILLASSHAQGHQWLEQTARQYGPILNTEVRTLESWSVERLKLVLAKNRIRYITSLEVKWIVYRLLQELAGTPDSYLDGASLTPGLTHAFHKAIGELRGAGVRASELEEDSFEPAAKGRLIKQLLACYEAHLLHAQLVDHAGLLPYAAQASQTCGIILLDPYAIRTAREHELLTALNSGGYFSLVAERSFTAVDTAFPVASARFFHALGPLAEAREVLRRIVDERIAWDQVELIASNEDTCAAAIQTVMAAGHIPCTFSSGLPLAVSRAGKAAKLYLEWLESGYHLDPLLAGLKQGVIRFRGEQQDEVSSADLIRELERSGIGWGRERYLLFSSMLTIQDLSPARKLIVHQLQLIFDALFHPLTMETLASPAKLMQSLVAFVEKHAALSEEQDHQVLNGLRQLKQSLLCVGELAMQPALALCYVKEEVEQLRVQVSGTPSAGCIHVSTLANGGQSGRAYTFFIGMTEQSWATSLRQDPILLDEERARISPSLPLSSDRARLLLEERCGRFGMIRGVCTLSCSTYEIGDQQECLPAYEMLQLFRLNRGQPDADYETLQREMGERVGLFSSSNGMTADAMETWMRVLVSTQSRMLSGGKVVYAAYPFLKEGKLAELTRQEIKWSAYDGLIETDRYPVPLVDDAGEGKAFSASKFELYGRCPLQFFYQEVLGVRAKDVAVFDRKAWLNPLQRGSLLHEIFNQYLMELRNFNSSIPVTHNQIRLDELTEQAIQRYAVEVPAPSSAIFNKEAESIRKDAHIFFISEQRRTSSIVVFTELPLHKEASPLLLKLDIDLTVPLKGFVDRVDQIGPHQYAIVDYKTGGTRKYRHDEVFASGTQLQLPLYGMAVEQWMRESGYDAEAQVVESAYYFPTERGMGEEVSRPQNRRGELARLVGSMLGAMRAGTYPPAADPKSCARCDYKSVCGSQAESFAAKRTAPENALRLARHLEVNGYA